MLVFPTTNSGAASRLAPAGICNGMTAAWARLSRQRGGCSAADRAEIERAGAFSAVRARLALNQQGVQLHAEAGAQWTDMMSAQGLATALRHSAPIGGAIALAQRLLGFGDATAYIVFQFAGGGHAVGARTSATTCDFFDPNIGLSRADSRGAFPGLLATLMTTTRYPGWNTNTTYIWTVT